MARNNYPYTKYTETLMEFNANNPTFLSTLFSSLSGNDKYGTAYSEHLLTAFKAEFDIYEIGGETEGMFMKFVTDTYNKHLYMLRQRLEIYDNDKTLNNMLQRVERIDNTVVNEYDSTDTTTPNLTDTEYELPNRDTTNSTPSRKSTTTGNSAIDYDGTDTTTTDYTRTNTDNTEFINIKNAYYRQIKDIIREFVLLFYDCFILIY